MEVETKYILEARTTKAHEQNTVTKNQIGLGSSNYEENKKSENLKITGIYLKRAFIVLSLSSKIISFR